MKSSVEAIFHIGLFCFEIASRFSSAFLLALMEKDCGLKNVRLISGEFFVPSLAVFRGIVDAEIDNLIGCTCDKENIYSRYK
jgi:hypothetical protein